MFDPGKVGKYRSSVSDYVNAGIAGASGLSKNLAVARRNAPDYQDLVRKSMEARSAERINMIKAEKDLRQVGMKADAQVEALKIETDADLKGLKKKAGAKRFAGLVGAAGAVAVGVADGFMQKKQNAADAKRDADRLAFMDQHYQKLRDLIKDNSQPYERGDNPYSLSNQDNSGDSPAGNENNSSGNSDGSTDTTTSSQPKLSTPQPSTPNPGSTYSQDQMKKLGVEFGLSDSEATTFAAIGMAESNGRTGIDTVQSGLDTDKSNEYSIGLWQVNSQAHMDKLNRRGWTIDDLRDPRKNAEIAVEIYRERGNFEPWGAYTNGSYQQFL